MYGLFLLTVLMTKPDIGRQIEYYEGGGITRLGEVHSYGFNFVKVRWFTEQRRLANPYIPNGDFPIDEISTYKLEDYNRWIRDGTFE